MRKSEELVRIAKASVMAWGAHTGQHALMMDLITEGGVADLWEEIALSMYELGRADMEAEIGGRKSHLENLKDSFRRLLK